MRPSQEVSDRPMVLCVDASDVVRTVLRRMLTDAGCNVAEADNGLAALTMIAECDALPDAVIIDVTLPGLSGFDEIAIPGADASDPAAVKAAVQAQLSQPTPDRLRVIAQAFRHGLSVEEVRVACAYEPWFLRQIEEIIAAEAEIADKGLPCDAAGFRRLKAAGFSDARLSALTDAFEHGR